MFDLNGKNGLYDLLGVAAAMHEEPSDGNKPDPVPPSSAPCCLFVVIFVVLVAIILAIIL